MDNFFSRCKNFLARIWFYHHHMLWREMKYIRKELMNNRNAINKITVDVDHILLSEHLEKVNAVASVSFSLNEYTKKFDDKLKTERKNRIKSVQNLNLNMKKQIEPSIEGYAIAKTLLKEIDQIKNKMKFGDTIKRLASIETRITLLESKPHGSGEALPGTITTHKN